MKIEEVALEEYGPKLEQLHDDDEICEKEEVRLKKQRGFIKDEVNSIANLLGSATERVELVIHGLGFDRQVRRLGGGLDITVLEAALGTKLFRELCCNKLTIYEFDMDKLEAARKLGKVDDDTMAKCVVEPKISNVVKRVG